MSTQMGELQHARELLTKHLLALNGVAEAEEVMRGEWDSGASIRALVEALSTREADYTDTMSTPKQQAYIAEQLRLESEGEQ